MIPLLLAAAAVTVSGIATGQRIQTVRPARRLYLLGVLCLWASVSGVLVTKLGVGTDTDLDVRTGYETTHTGTTVGAAMGEG